MPPARPAIAASLVLEHPCAAAAPTSSCEASSSSGCELNRHRRDRRHAVGRGEPALDRPAGRADQPRPRRRPVPPRWRSSSDDASSIQCTSSITSSVGPARSGRARLDHAVEPSAAEGRLQLLDLLRGLDLDVERERDERQPRHELGHELLHALAQPRGRGAVLRQLEQRAQQPAEGEVRRRGLVLRACGRHGEQVGRLRLQLLDQPRLAHPGLADQLDDVAEAHAHRARAPPRESQLALAADERQPALRAPLQPRRRRRRRRSRRPARRSPSASAARARPSRRCCASARAARVVVSTWPGLALPISRAASAAVLPRIVYVRRNRAPTSPAKTRPRRCRSAAAARS